MILIVVGALGMVLEELEISARIEKIQTIKIGQNTEKGPGDLRRLAVTQT